MMKLKHDISQYYFLKKTSEDLFGETAWYEIKECTSIFKWKAYCKKILRAVFIAAKNTVSIVDDNWFEELESEINQGNEYISLSKEIDDVFSAFSATLTRIIFLQLGSIPKRKTLKKVTLNKYYWQLNKIRSVQYVQNREQKKIK